MKIIIIYNIKTTREILMKTLLCLSILCVCSTSFAHEPFVAPLAYTTENTQIPVIAGYAEQALQPEYALKDVQLTVIQPEQTQVTLDAQALESMSSFHLPLPEQGTYTLYTTTAYPIQYVKHQQQWKIFADVPAEQAPAITERDYVIASDFNGKQPNKVKTVHEWTLQTYLSKGSPSAVANTTAPIQVSFNTHPNQLVAQQSIQLQLKKDNLAFTTAQVTIRAQGATEAQAQDIAVQPDGTARFSFPHAGQYLVEVTEKIDPQAMPKNQNYTIISLQVAPPKS
jgi:hypothetical protein